MAEIVAHLAASLTAETAEWGRGLDQARDKLASSGAAMNRSMAGIEKGAVSVGNMITTFIGIGTVVAFASATKSALNFADSISEAAKQAGLTTKAYQELDYAQRVSGGSTESWNRGIRTFTNLIGEAAAGSKTAVDALRAVGITQQDLLKQDVATLYTRASDGLSKYTTAADRATAAQNLFGKAAKESGNAFALSAAELANLRTQASATGQVLDSATIANAKEANDRLDELTRTIKNDLTQALVQFAPALIASAKFVRDLGEMAGWAARKVGLLADTTKEQEYQSLLEKRLKIVNNIAYLQGGALEIFNGGSLEKNQAALNDIDTRLASIRQKQQAAQASEAAPSVGAVSSVSPVKGADQGDKSALELVRRIQRAAQESNAALTSDAAQGAQARMAITRQEFEFKASQMNLSVAQAGQVQAALQQFDDAARFAKQAEAEAAFEANLVKYESMVAAIDAEYALEIERRDALLELDRVYQELGLEQDEKYAALKRDVIIRTESKSMGFLATAQAAQKKGDELNWKQKTALAGTALTGLSALMQSESKKQFEIGKKAAIAGALVSTYQAVASGLATTPFFPLGIAMGAVALAVGLSNIQRIKSQQFGGAGGGGGSIPTPSAASAGASSAGNDATAPAGSDIAQAPNSASTPRRTINVYLQGSGRYSSAEIRELVGQINEEQADGDRVEAFA